MCQAHRCLKAVSLWPCSILQIAVCCGTPKNQMDARLIAALLEELPTASGL